MSSGIAIGNSTKKGSFRLKKGLPSQKKGT